MLGSPIQNNNLMNLLFSARKGGTGSGGNLDVGTAEQQDFLKFLNTVKDAIQQTRTEKSLDKIGIPDKKSVDKANKPEKQDTAADKNTEVSEVATDAEASHVAKPQDPKQTLSKTLEDLTAILQQWQQQLAPDTPGEGAEGESRDNPLSDALNALLAEIQALQATLPQPVLDEAAPDLLTPLTAIDELSGIENATEPTTPAMTESLWEQATAAVDAFLPEAPVETTTEVEAIAIPTEQISEQPEGLTDLPPTPETPSEQPSATLDSAKLEKLMVKVANIMETAPEDAKTALQQVSAKVKSLADILAERPKGKSIQQMQFEAMLPKVESKSSDDTSAVSTFNNITLMGTVSAQSVVEGLAQINGTNSGAVSAQGTAQAAVPAPHDQVVEAATMSIQAGKKEISIKLMPSELGEVRMTLNSTGQNQVSARLVAETPEAKQALEKNLDQLIRSLEASGIKIGKIQVMQAGQTENGNPFADGNNNPQSGSDSALFQQRQQQQQQQAFSMANSFNDGNSSSFMDGGSSQAGDDASSSQSFDTDVEGEEVSSTSSVQDDGSVDVRI